MSGRRFFLLFLHVMLAVWISACVEESPNATTEMSFDDELLETKQQKIYEFRPEAFSIKDYYLTESAGTSLFASWPASIKYEGGGSCSGVMISPDVLQTADHCGSDSNAQGLAHFITYNESGSNSSVPGNIETFTCDKMVGSYNDSDLQYLRCQPNAAGELPGIKYGYLDYDPTVVAIEDEVLSYWWNPVTSLGLNWQIIVSNGEIYDQTTGCWYCINGSTPQQKTDAWGDHGGSGRVFLDPNSHRIILGPASTGATDAPGVNALSIEDYMYWGKITSVNTGVFNQWGITPPIQGTYFDMDLDYLPDAMELIDHEFGEPQRDFYNLDFESQRRNEVWTRGSGTTFEWQNKRLSFNRSSSGDIVKHERLNLKPNTTYRATFSSYISSSGGGYLYLWASGGGASGYAGTNHGSYWLTKKFEFTTGSDPQNTDLRLYVSSAMSGYVNLVSLHEADTIHDFDSQDKRALWYNPSQPANSRASTVVDGKNNSSNIDWAGVVWGKTGVGNYDNYTLTTKRLALLDSTSYRFCFDIRYNPGAQIAHESAKLVFKITTQSSPKYLASYVVPSAGWTNYCSPYVETGSGLTRIDFGLKHSRDGESVLVDNITVEKL